MKHLSLKNFRAFKGATDFDIAPITILTGTNSSGKSSFTDALRIFSNYFDRCKEKIYDYGGIQGLMQLEVEDLIDRIPSFKLLVNESAPDQTFAVSFDYQFTNIADKFSVEFVFSGANDNNGKLVELTFISQGTQRSNPEKSPVVLHLAYRSENKYAISLDYLYFRKHFKNEIKKQQSFFEVLHDYKMVKDSDALYNWFDDENLESRLREVHEPLWHHYFQHVFPPAQREAPLQYPVRPFEKILATNNWHFDEGIFKRFMSLDLKVPFYNYRLKDKSLSDRFNELVESLPESINKSDFDPLTVLEVAWLSKAFGGGVVGTIEGIEILFKNPLAVTSGWYENDEARQSLKSPEHSIFIQLITEIFDISLPGRFHLEFGRGRESDIVSNTGVYFFDSLWEFLAGAFTSFKWTPIYIPSIRNQPKRFYQNKRETYFEQLLASFLDLPKIRSVEAPGNTIIQDFIKFCLNKLEIADDLKVERNEDLGVKTIYVIKEGKQINLLDLGFGYSQILPIIIQIAKLAAEHFIEFEHDFYESHMIIEEPETNLHPALQSKLADVFVEAHKRFNINFIIETHSEYLIRKLQYLTARNDSNLKPEDTVIYYFYHPDRIPEGEPQVKKISINDDGSLSDDFGSGFFDEADKIAISILGLQNAAQHN